MRSDREDFFAGYDPAELDQEESLTLTHRDLLLIRVAVGTYLRESSRKDHVYGDLHRLLSKLPAPIERRGPAQGAPLDEIVAPDPWLRR